RYPARAARSAGVRSLPLPLDGGRQGGDDLRGPPSWPDRAPTHTLPHRGGGLLICSSGSGAMAVVARAVRCHYVLGAAGRCDWRCLGVCSAAAEQEARLLLFPAWPPNGQTPVRAFGLAGIVAAEPIRRDLDMASNGKVALVT